MKTARRIAAYSILGLLVTHLVACGEASTDTETGTPVFGGGGQGSSNQTGATAVGTVDTGGAAAPGGTNTGGTTATGGSTAADVDENGMPLLPQGGNPIDQALDNYKKYLPGTPEGDKKWGDIVVSWQFTTGAYPKSGFDHEYKLGIATEEDRAVAQAFRIRGTFDNGSTITELVSLGYAYKTFKDPKHQVAAQKTLDWVLSAQGATGGWPQWHPARTGSSAYSAHATFNDEGMMRVMIALQKAVRKQDPFDSDIFTAEQLTKSKAAIEKGVEYILKSQIVTGGKPTVWCAQHNMATYQAEGARTFELASKSGQESALIVSFLMSRNQTPDIAKAVEPRRLSRRLQPERGWSLWEQQSGIRRKYGSERYG